MHHRRGDDEFLCEEFRDSVASGFGRVLQGEPARSHHVQHSAEFRFQRPRWNQDKPRQRVSLPLEPSALRLQYAKDYGFPLGYAAEFQHLEQISVKNPVR